MLVAKIYVAFCMLYLSAALEADSLTIDESENRHFIFPTIFPLPCSPPCLPSKVCIGGRCVCHFGTISLSGVCYPFPIKPCGGRCKRDEICKKNKCVCKSGGKIDGRCEDCRWPKEFKKCSTNCPLTCDHPHPRICNKACREDVHCVCPKGWIERSGTDSTCVRPKDCSKCPEPKEYEDCPTSCPDNCDNINDPGPRICITACRKHKCVCPDGYIERSKTDYSCVRPWKCPNQCGSCPPHSICKRGRCKCKDGYIDRMGKCVEKCTGDLEYNSCRCQGTCESGPILCATCNPGCFCPGKMLPDGDKCYEPDQCPSRCPEPKIYKRCPSACPDNCDNINDSGPRACPAVCRTHKCVCPDGYIERSDTDYSCVRPWKCPNQCGSCPPHSICKKGNCKCKDGYFDRRGNCVDRCIVMRISCPSGEECRGGKCRPKKCSGDLEYRCACPATTCKNPSVVCVRCQDGCFCPPDKLPHGDRCYKPGQCPNVCGSCPENSICKYGKCECKKGYFLHKGKCADDCIRMLCRRNHICKHGKCIRKKCSGDLEYRCACPATTCKNPSAVCVTCEDGCFCPPGKLPYGDRCYKPGQCPEVCGGTVCKSYERCVYNRCVSIIVAG